jgi:uncharacterized Ntn-hydrolase superfamily protein
MSHLFFATFSIVAYDPESESWGVVVASKYLGAGAYVPYAKAGVGAIATQSFTNITYGLKGLELLSLGKSAKETLDELLATDPNPEVRQVGIVDAKGNSAAFTGNECVVWAGEIIGKGYTIQGNMLVGEKVLLEMEKTYLSAKGTFAERLCEALLAGEKAGGDKRGKQSASLLISKKTEWNNMTTDRFIDLRVDDHKHPVEELKRILKLHYYA